MLGFIPRPIRVFAVGLSDTDKTALSKLNSLTLNYTDYNAQLIAKNVFVINDFQFVEKAFKNRFKMLDQKSQLFVANVSFSI